MRLMTTANSFSIRLGLDEGRTLVVARRALVELGWPLSVDEADRLVASEDFTQLCCNRQPIEVEVTIVLSGDGETTLDVLARVPGRGPIASEHLRTQSAVLVRRIHDVRRGEPEGSRRPPS